MRAFLLWLFLAMPAFAVQPDEILKDPALEARAREISRDLRCPVCQGENIDDSNAGVARDLRLLVRDRLTAGDSNDQVVQYVVDRYGEYVLFRPERRGANLILYWLGPGVLVVALAGVLLWLRRRRAEAPVEALSPEEEARLQELLRK